MLFFVFLQSAIAQEKPSESNYYWYGSEQITLELAKDRLLVTFKADLTTDQQKRIVDNYDISFEEIQPLPNSFRATVVLKEGMEEAKLRKKIAALIDDEQVEYVAPFYKFGDIYQSVNGTILVKLSSPGDYSDLARMVNDHNCTILNENEFVTGLFTVAVPKKGDVLKVANLFHKSGLFEYAEPDFIKFLNRLSNDPLFSTQWSLENLGTTTYPGGTVDSDMDVVEAWDTTMGNSSIKIAVLDEGVDLAHPDLINNLLPGYDATGLGSNGGPSNDDAHGTACAGIIAAQANNSIGMAGVAPNCKIIPVRIAYGNGSGGWITSDTWIGNAINWAWQTANADILSNSWGGGSPSTTITNAFTSAVTLGRSGLGAPVLVAAGNSDGAVSFPATLSNIICVGAMSMCNERKSTTSCDGETWWGSNYGAELDVMAPGVKIVATDISGTAGYVTGDYTSTFNGTSSATPNAAGVMALILSQDVSLSEGQARILLESSCEKVGGYAYASTSGYPNGTRHNEMGYGRVNAHNALILLSGGCFSPFNLTASNVGSSSATITWTSSESNFNIEYGAMGFTQGSGTSSTTIDTFKFVSGLSAGTFYDVYVQANCGGGSLSPWAGPFTFSTTCGSLSATTLPYFEGFESYVGTFVGTQNIICTSAAHWNFETSSSTNGRVRVGTDAYLSNTGTGAATLDGVTSGTYQENYLILTLDLTNYASANNLELSFDFADHGDEVHVQDRVWIRGSNTDAWLEIYDWSIINNSNFTSVAGLDIDALLSTNGQIPTSTFQVRFGQYDNYPAATDGLSIDNVRVMQVTCPSPSSLTATNVTSTTANLNWVAGGTETQWNIEYGFYGFVKGSGTSASVTSNPYALTGLASSTTYSYYVQANCGSSDTSVWVGPYSFTTPFASYCSGTTTLTSNSGSFDDGSGANSYANGTDCSWLIQPSSGSAIVLNFNSFALESCCDYVYIYDGATTSSPLLGSYNGTTLPPTMTSSGGSMLIRFTTDGSVTYNGWDVSYHTCAAPSSLSATNFTSTTADLGWVVNGSETQWFVEYGVSGFTAGSGTMISVNSNPYTLTGLSQGTSYDFYVQANCGGGDTSTFAGPHTFLSPAFIVSPDSLNVTLFIGDSTIQDLYVSNLTGSTIQYSAYTDTLSGGIYDENFESGNYNSLTSAGGSYTYNMTTANTASGQYSLEMVGNGSHYSGLYHNFGFDTPSYISFDVKSASTTAADGYFVIGNTGAFGDGMIWFYCKEDGQMGVYDGTTMYSIAYNINQWYHIEFRDINYSTQVYDLYIDGVLINANVPFRESVSSIDEFKIYNFHSSTATYDNFVIGNGSAVDWLSVISGGGNINASGTDTVAVKFNATGLSTGVYSSAVTISSSSPFSQTVTVPCVLNVMHQTQRLFVDHTATGANNGTSWANAFTNLQNAIDASFVGDEIWVAQGTYKPTSYPTGCVSCSSNRDYSFSVDKDIRIYGGFNGTETLLSQADPAANATILSGDLNGDDVVSGSGSSISFTNNSENTYHVVITANVSSAAVIDGFFIMGGNATGSGGISYSGYTIDRSIGGAQYNTSSNVSLNNCTFSESFTNSSGGGLYNLNASGISITNCVFERNYGGWGGGNRNDNSTIAFTNCIFDGNYATNNGGAQNNDNCTTTLTNCVFNENYGGQRGGGQLNWNASSYLANCTFSKNSTPNLGGAQYNYSAPALTVTNCIFWDNTKSGSTNISGADIENSGSSPVVTYSLTQDNSPHSTGTGIINNQNPLFDNANDGNGADNQWMTADDGLRILGSSPVIDAGTAVGGVAATDILGTARPQGSAYDFGAYEGVAAASNIFTFNMGNAVATPGSTVSIPVTVLNCTDIVTMQMSMHFDSSQLTNIGYSNFGLPFLSASNFGAPSTGTVTYSWDDPTFVGVTTPDSTTIFTLNLTVSNSATPGSILPITINGYPLSIEVADNTFNVIPSTRNNGNITIINTVDVGGSIVNELNQGVQTATVNLTGGAIASDVTDGFGNYDFTGLNVNQNYTLCPVKNTNPGNGVSTLDIVFMRLHILGTTLLNSPYKIIAADVNKSNNVSTLDIVFTRQVILGTATGFPNNTSWRFVPSSYVFPNPTNPFANTFPECITLNSLTANSLSEDFVGIKVGDLNLTSNPTGLQAGSNDYIVRNTRELPFVIQDKTFNAGDTVEAQFKARDFQDIIGYQYTIEFNDRILSYNEVIAHQNTLTGLTANSFGMQQAAQGLITTSWNDASVAGVTLNDDDIIYTLKFVATQSGRLSEVLTLNSSEIRSEAYDNGFDIFVVTPIFETVTNTGTVQEGGFTLYQNRPNPFNGSTAIGFELPKTTDGELVIYDQLGRKVKSYNATYQAGYNEIQVDDLQSAGVYYYELITKTHRATRKMIILE